MSEKEYFNVADIFGENVFNDAVMRERLQRKFTKNFMKSWRKERIDNGNSRCRCT